MKKLLCFITLILWFVSCTDSGDSPLKGKWQLKTVEKEGILSSVDTLWYNFQSKSLFSLQIYIAQRDTFIQSVGFRMEQGNILEIEMLSSAYLENTDWTDVKRTFTIEKCKGGKLVLISEENYIYRFIRF
jgi:hypothetical protein